MPIIFTKSARASAMEKALMALVAIIVGGGFAALIILLDDLHIAVIIAAGLAVLCSVWMAIKIIDEALSILKRGQDWRVEISGSHLSWHSPVPEIMQSFSVPLAHIRAVRHVYTQYKNSNRSPSNKFYIEFTNGQSYELKEQKVGISPMKVFKALQGVGIHFIEDRKIAGSKVKISVS